MSRDIFGCHHWGDMLLASSGYRPGMLLNFRQDSPHEKELSGFKRQ